MTSTWIPMAYLLAVGVWLLVWVWRDLPRSGRVAALAVRLGLRGDQ